MTLRRIFEPASIAVVGASANPAKRGSGSHCFHGADRRPGLSYPNRDRRSRIERAFPDNPGRNQCLREPCFP